jgi:hypothetical protein
MPNSNGLNTDWRTHRVSVDYVENLTGHNYFSNVNPTIQAQIESVVDTQLIEDWEMRPDEEAIAEAKAEADTGRVKK